MNLSPPLFVRDFWMFLSLISLPNQIEQWSSEHPVSCKVQNWFVPEFTVYTTARFAAQCQIIGRLLHRTTQAVGTGNKHGVARRVSLNTAKTPCFPGSAANSGARDSSRDLHTARGAEPILKFPRHSAVKFIPRPALFLLNIWCVCPHQILSERTLEPC